MSETKPEDIPEDVMDAAYELANGNHGEEALMLGIARAIMAERERLTDPAFLEKHLTAVGVVAAEAVNEAVLAERERCAKIADSEKLTGSIPDEWTVRETLLVNQAVQATASSIASRIRSGDTNG